MRKFLKTWLDPYILAIVTSLVVGFNLPVGAGAAAFLNVAVQVAVGILFMVFGMRLSLTEVKDGLSNLRLQGSVLVSTFLVFPLIGLLFYWVTLPLLGPSMAVGVLFLSLLPSTVQSSVVLIAIARGNVAAGIVSATVSNVLGIFITPLLVVLFIQIGGPDASLAGLQGVLLNLLAPFILGHVLRRWTGSWIGANRRLATLLDKGVILLVVFKASSSAVGSVTINGRDVLLVVAVCGAMLALILGATWLAGGLLKLGPEDRVVLLIAGSFKSLATGLPMAAIILPAEVAVWVAIPVIVYHQLQLITCAIITRRLAAKDQNLLGPTPQT
jgi:sodium/bile acid cotransporter 7